MRRYYFFFLFFNLKIKSICVYYVCRSGAPSQLSTSLSVKRKSLATDGTTSSKSKDDDDDNDSDYENKATKRFSAPFTKSDNYKKSKVATIKHQYDASSFRYYIK
jgi:hypothetical protein